MGCVLLLLMICVVPESPSDAAPARQAGPAAPAGPQWEAIEANVRHKLAQGFLLVDGKWAEPQMHLQWSDVLAFDIEHGDAWIRPALSDENFEKLRNNRRVLVTVGRDRRAFVLYGQRQWVNGRRQQGSWARLDAVRQPDEDPGDWRLDKLTISQSTFSLLASRQSDGRTSQQVINGHEGRQMIAVTTELADDEHNARRTGRVVLQGTDADLTALMVADDVQESLYSWEVLELLTDAPVHPLRPLPSDVATGPASAETEAAVDALLPRMIDRRGAERDAASAALADLGHDATPAVLERLRQPLLPEQRRRLEGFIGNHTLYRDDAASDAELRALLDR